MASDDVNIAEDAEMVDYDGDKVVTMMDVLQEQQEFEDDVNAVLGASDDKNCTYPKGYIKRQALYACLTCCTEAKTDPTKRAGVCLACSLTCHENHELIELYTKRNFRCDCGNPKFNSHPCQFTSTKTDFNEDNIYNQNFSGLYCTCHRPYPDLDATTEDDMIQCIICEDWLHASHLEATVPANDQYSEMVCKGCMDKNEFLHDYTGFAVNLENGEVDIITVNGDANSADYSLCNGNTEKEKLINGVDSHENETKPTDDIQLNGDVEMNDDSKKSDKSSEIIQNNPIENIITCDPSEETKVEKSNDEESTDPVLQTELEKEQTMDNTDQSVENEDNTIKTDESNVTDDKDLDTKSADKADQFEATEIEDKAPNTNDNATKEHTETENLDKTTKEHSETECEDNATNEHTATEEQNDQDNSDNATNSNTKTEQLADNDSTLISDNLTSGKEKGEPSEEKSVEIPEKVPIVSEDSTQSEELKENSEDKSDSVMDAIEDSTQSEELKENSEDKSDSVMDAIEDSTQSEELKENSEDKSDSVMDAIDEILDAKYGDTKVENQDDVSASKDTKENSESIDTKASDDVEMTSIENNVDANATECTEKTKEAEYKTAVAVEINASAEQGEAQLTENKMNAESVDSTKDVSIAASDSEAVDENKMVKATPSDEAKPSTEEATEKTNPESEEKIEQAAEDTTNEIKTKEDNEAADVQDNTSEHKRKLSIDLSEDVSSKKAKLEAECVRPRGVKKVHKGATFWPSTFRQKLCTCGECISMYKDLNVLFLTDLEDTVSAYESLGKENAGGASQYEKGLEALSSLDRIQQINALTEYNNMRDKLVDFLKTFKDRKEIVKEEDIKAFFAGMKPRREPDGVYFCR